MSAQQSFREFPAPFVIGFNGFQELSGQGSPLASLQQALVDLIHLAASESVFSLMLASHPDEGRIWVSTASTRQMTTFKTSVPSSVLSDLYMTALSLSEEKPEFTSPGTHQKLIGHITSKSLDPIGRTLPVRRKYIEIEAERDSNGKSFALLSL
jgi:hypothetical protein